MKHKKTPAEEQNGECAEGARAITQSVVIVPRGKDEKQVSEHIIEEPMTVPEHWVCDSDGKAKWVCEQIKKIDDNRDYMVAWYQEQIKKAKESAEFDRMKWESYLAAYFDTVPHKKASKSESYSFPGGKLILKRQEPEFKKDEKAAIEWLKQNGGTEFVKTKEELAWKELKESCAGFVDGKVVLREEITEDGEILQITVPGIEVIDREDKFCVEV